MACFTIAQAPATCGAAIDVPSYTSKLPPGTEERIEDPGASSESWGDMSEKSETSSSFVVEPTLTADEIQAGNARAAGSPSFPAATLVGMPTDRRLLMRAVICGSSVSQAEVKASPPRLMLAAAIAYWLRNSYTNSSPAPMSLVNARAHGTDSKNGKQSDTELWKTWTAIRLAPFATPEKPAPMASPFPAATPATCRPCLHASGA